MSAPAVSQSYGYVYVLFGRVGARIAFVKIGKTTDPCGRIDLIAETYDRVQPLLPFRVEVGPVFKCWIGNEGHAERWLHERFHSQRLRGEWFEYTDEIAAFLQADPLAMPYPVTLAYPPKTS